MVKIKPVCFQFILELPSKNTSVQSEKLFDQRALHQDKILHRYGSAVRPASPSSHQPGSMDEPKLSDSEIIEKQGAEIKNLTEKLKRVIEKLKTKARELQEFQKTSKNREDSLQKSLDDSKVSHDELKVKYLKQQRRYNQGIKEQSDSFAEKLKRKHEALESVEADNQILIQKFNRLQRKSEDKVSRLEDQIKEMSLAYSELSSIYDKASEHIEYEAGYKQILLDENLSYGGKIKEIQEENNKLESENKRLQEELAALKKQSKDRELNLQENLCEMKRSYENLQKQLKQTREPESKPLPDKKKGLLKRLFFRKRSVQKTPTPNHFPESSEPLQEALEKLRRSHDDLKVKYKASVRDVQKQKQKYEELQKQVGRSSETTPESTEPPKKKSLLEWLGFRLKPSKKLQKRLNQLTLAYDKLKSEYEASIQDAQQKEVDFEKQRVSLKRKILNLQKQMHSLETDKQIGENNLSFQQTHSENRELELQAKIERIQQKTLKLKTENETLQRELKASKDTLSHTRLSYKKLLLLHKTLDHNSNPEV